MARVNRDVTLPALAAGDPFPTGSYSVGLTKIVAGGTSALSPVRIVGLEQPWTICCGDGRAIVGWIDSKATAYAVAAALNAVYPGPRRRRA